MTDGALPMARGALPMARAVMDRYVELRDEVEAAQETLGAPDRDLAHRCALEALRIQLERELAVLPGAAEATLVVLSPVPSTSSNAAPRN